MTSWSVVFQDGSRAIPKEEEEEREKSGEKRDTDRKSVGSVAIKKGDRTKSPVTCTCASLCLRKKDRGPFGEKVDRGGETNPARGGGRRGADRRKGTKTNMPSR